MSMDLAKKTYSTTPDYFIAGTTVGIVTAAKEASAAIAAHNLVLMDGGKVKPLAAVDSSNALNVTGLYGIAAEDAASGKDAVVYLTGEFFAEGLALPDGVAAADIEVALRNIPTLAERTRAAIRPPSACNTGCAKCSASRGRAGTA